MSRIPRVPGDASLPGFCGASGGTGCELHSALTIGAKASRRSLVRNNPWKTGPLSLVSTGAAGSVTGKDADVKAGLTANCTAGIEATDLTAVTGFAATAVGVSIGGCPRATL